MLQCLFVNHCWFDFSDRQASPEQRREVFANTRAGGDESNNVGAGHMVLVAFRGMTVVRNGIVQVGNVKQTGKGIKAESEVFMKVTRDQEEAEMLTCRRLDSRRL